MVRAIKTPSGHGAVAQENRAGAWKARWRHVPCRTPATTGSDLLYVRFEGEEKFHVTFLNLFGRYRHNEGIAPDVRFVAFPRTFDSCYSVENRGRWGGDSARESRLRWRRVDDFFHMWHSTEFLLASSAARRVAACTPRFRRTGRRSRRRSTCSYRPRAPWRMLRRISCRSAERSPCKRIERSSWCT